MGADGGTISTNRKYLRGAKSSSQSSEGSSAAAERKTQREEELRSCSISGEALDFRSPIVACRLGKLYSKESLLNFLLKPKATRRSIEKMRHIRNLKSVVLCNFTLAEDTPVCPITHDTMNIQHPFVVVWENGNVYSARAVRDIPSACDLGSGGHSKLVHLAPTQEMRDAMRSELRKKKSGSKRKRKLRDDGSEKTAKPSHAATPGGKHDEGPGGTGTKSYPSAAELFALSGACPLRQ